MCKQTIVQEMCVYCRQPSSMCMCVVNQANVCMTCSYTFICALNAVKQKYVRESCSSNMSTWYVRNPVMHAMCMSFSQLSSMCTHVVKQANECALNAVWVSNMCTHCRYASNVQLSKLYSHAIQLRKQCACHIVYQSIFARDVPKSAYSVV